MIAALCALDTQSPKPTGSDTQSNTPTHQHTQHTHLVAQQQGHQLCHELLLLQVHSRLGCLWVDDLGQQVSAPPNVVADAADADTAGSRLGGASALKANVRTSEGAAACNSLLLHEARLPAHRATAS